MSCWRSAFTRSGSPGSSAAEEVEIRRRLARRWPGSAWVWRWPPCRSCRWRPTWRRARSGAIVRAKPPPGGRSSRPRWLDARLHGDSLRLRQPTLGHPNLARALGVHNLNESAGGFAGLATADLAGSAGIRHARRGRSTWRFLVGMVALRRDGRLPPSAGRQPLAGPSRARRHRQPPADALGRLRADDPGGIGLDQLGRIRSPGSRAWIAMVIVGAIAAGIAGAGGPAQFEPAVRSGPSPITETRRSGDRRRRSGHLPGPRRSPGAAHPGVPPAHYGLAAAELGVLAALTGVPSAHATCVRPGHRPWSWR